MANRRKRFVESLARHNQAFYDTPDGRAMLRLFELTFEHRWIYVFELVQNALDAGARSIAFQCSDDGDCLTFQHDGQSAIGRAGGRGAFEALSIHQGRHHRGFHGHRLQERLWALPGSANLRMGLDVSVRNARDHRP